jgi:transcriptional regulator with XRE-family HTH domain
MPEDADVWQALLRAKGLTVAQLAEDLRTTRQHAHRLLTGKRSADARREELDRALALGPRRTTGRPLYAVATLDPDGELELVPAGDTQPLYADRDLATNVAESLQELDQGICVVPVWPEYAWRRTVAFYAAWGSTAEPRNVFLVDDPDSGVPPQNLLDELYGGYAVTVRLRAVAEDSLRLREVESLLESLSDQGGAIGETEETAPSPRQRITGYLGHQERDDDDTSDTLDPATDEADAERLH